MVFSHPQPVATTGNQIESSITWFCRLTGIAILLAVVALTFTFGTVNAQDTVTAAADPWNLSCVDCPRFFESMTDRSLRLDSSNRPNLAYGGDHLYFSAFDGSAWISETVDSAAGVGAYASLVLSSTNQPHISYYDALNGDLKYATKSGLLWTIETVDSVGDVDRA